MSSLFEVKDLKTYFMIEKQEIKAVDGVTFSLERNETLAIVGESGSGKSVTALSAMRLIKPPGKTVGGEIMFGGTNLLHLTEKQMTMVRGNRISMVYQEPMTSLNPVISVGEQIREVIVLHKKSSGRASKERAIELMNFVSIPEARLRYNELPAKFSGGMRQRIMIAMSIACNPDILIADEPTTALDVTIQAEIMELLRSMKNKLKMSMLLITHDLGIVAENADRVIVMYCGRIMEETSVESLFRYPMHPYTVGLMNCIPSIDTKVSKLNAIPGYVPHPSRYPEGCRFSNRCGRVMDICSKEMPELIEMEEGHKVRCWLYARGGGV
ncbi:MAG: peptide ABC transporter ATP-binding protein [Clostridia bacterium BRH_c25]|nr:MAG: peptide ABC transporter ATP-binding protein [Clostridia bacterium BRH_c25]